MGRASTFLDRLAAIHIDKVRALDTQQKLKIALDELRMLMMGSQIFFGFQFQAVFETRADAFDTVERSLLSAATLLMALVVGILVAAPSYHRLVEHGDANERVLRIVTAMASCALLPFAVSLGCDVALVTRQIANPRASWTIGGVSVCLSVALWYVVAIGIRETKEGSMPAVRTEHLPLHTKIDQMLTEARVILPGAQAVLGFQLIAMLTAPFDQLPDASKAIHLVSMLAVGLATILLMSPAALHRLGFGGEAEPAMLSLGSRLVTTALLPLGLGISGDVFVAVARLTESVPLGAAGGGGVLILLLVLWYAWPFFVSKGRRR